MRLKRLPPTVPTTYLLPYFQQRQPCHMQFTYEEGYDIPIKCDESSKSAQPVVSCASHSGEECELSLCSALTIRNQRSLYSLKDVHLSPTTVEEQLKRQRIIPNSNTSSGCGLSQQELRKSSQKCRTMRSSAGHPLDGAGGRVRENSPFLRINGLQIG